MVLRDMRKARRNYKGYRIDTRRELYWDYGAKGVYNIGINCENKVPYFGKCKNGVVCLSQVGQIAYNDWQNLPNHYPYLKLGTFIIMPDHMHGILFNLNPKKIEKYRMDKTMAEISPSKGSLPSIIRSFKGGVTRKCGDLSLKFKWQSSYHDQIIRDEDHLRNATRYIQDNPKNWRR